MRSLGGALGVGCGVAVATLLALSVLPLPANVAASTIPAQLAVALGLVAGLRLAEQVRPELGRLRRTLEVAFLLAAGFVVLALLGTSVSQEAIELGKKGACRSGYYLSDGLCHANALHRRFFPGWIVGLSSLGLVAWIAAFITERRKKAHVAGFTALLLGLGLGAATLQNAHYLDASLALDGDRVRAWNVFHYYLGSKYYRELGHQDIYAAVLAADDDYQASVLDSEKGKRSKAFRRSWHKIENARDLRSYKVLPRDELVDAFDRSTFSEERLRQLGADSRFFKPFMGWGSPGWHDTFRDLGFNPAPPWTVIGTPLASLVPTEWPLFWIISNSDLPFYLLAFGLIWWAFGLRMAAVMTLWLNCAQLNEARFTGGFLQYDWLVSSSPEVTQGDMVASALEKAANLDDVAGAIEGGASDERSEQASVLYSFSFLYYPKEDPAGPADIFTAANLQQMCEVENVVLGMGDYGSVCYNSTSPSTSIYTTDGSGSNCRLPFLSAVSLFYTARMAVSPSIFNVVLGDLLRGLTMSTWFMVLSCLATRSLRYCGALGLGLPSGNLYALLVRAR